jgi:hypothetical protein
MRVKVLILFCHACQDFVSDIYDNVIKQFIIYPKTRLVKSPDIYM